MAQNNMRKMFTEQQIIDLVEQNSSHLYMHEIYSYDQNNVLYIISTKKEKYDLSGTYNYEILSNDILKMIIYDDNASMYRDVWYISCNDSQTPDDVVACALNSASDINLSIDFTNHYSYDVKEII